MINEEEVSQLLTKVVADVIVSDKLKESDTKQDKERTFKIRIYDNNRVAISMHGYNPIKFKREFIGTRASDK